MNCRYDVRGHLYSESEFGLRKNDTDVDVVEAKLEEELDKERFMFLTVDELEFEAYLGKTSFFVILTICLQYLSLCCFEMSLKVMQFRNKEMKSSNRFSMTLA